MRAVLLTTAIAFFVSSVTAQCNTVHLDAGQRDRRGNANRLVIAEYNAEWLFKDGCAKINDFKNSISTRKIWDVDPTRDAAVYGAAMLTHLSNIAGYLDQLVQNKGVDIFVLIEVCDCATLEEVIRQMTVPNFRPYFVDQNADQRVGIISRFDPDHLPAGNQAVVNLVDPIVPKGLEAVFSLWGKTLSLYGVHLKAGTSTRDAATRLQQGEAIQRKYAPKLAGELVIVTGDFNVEAKPDISIKRLVWKFDSTLGITQQSIIDAFVASGNAELKWYAIQKADCKVTLSEDAGQLKLTGHTCPVGQPLPTGHHVTDIGKTAVNTYAEAKVALNAAKVDNPRQFVAMKMDNGVLIRAPIRDWDSVAGTFVYDHKYKVSRTITLELQDVANQLQVHAVVPPVPAGASTVGYFVHKVNGVETPNYADAVSALRASPASSKIQVEFRRINPTPITVMTENLRNIEPVGLAAAEKYTHSQSDPKKVIDHFFVSPLIQTKCNPSVEYSHVAGKQGGKYSDHEPVILTLSIPPVAGAARWTAHVAEYDAYDEEWLMDEDYGINDAHSYSYLFEPAPERENTYLFAALTLLDAFLVFCVLGVCCLLFGLVAGYTAYKAGKQYNLPF